MTDRHDGRRRDHRHRRHRPRFTWESTAPAGIAVGKAGSVNADTTGGTISLQADSLTIDGSATAATVQLAPATSGLTVTLGTSGNGLSVASLTGVTAGTVVLGGVKQPAGASTTTAGSIAVDGPLAFGGAATVALYAALLHRRRSQRRDPRPRR